MERVDGGRKHRRLGCRHNREGGIFGLGIIFFGLGKEMSQLTSLILYLSKVSESHIANSPL